MTATSLRALDECHPIERQHTCELVEGEALDPRRHGVGRADLHERDGRNDLLHQVPVELDPALQLVGAVVLMHRSIRSSMLGTTVTEYPQDSSWEGEAPTIVGLEPEPRIAF